jgi:hypothetical protein
MAVERTCGSTTFLSIATMPCGVVDVAACRMLE